MKSPAIIFIVIGLIGAALLTFSMVTYMNKKQPIVTVVEKEQTQPIVVANSNLALGTRLSEENLRLVAWSEKNRPAGYFSSFEAVKGRVLLQNVAENEAILEPKLTPTGSKHAGLTPIIEEGRRAFSIRVTDVISVAGYTTPGTKVDVLVTGVPQGGRGAQTKTILQNIPVLTAGQQIEYNPDGKPIANVTVVTLQVTPEEAEKLSLASLEGKIQLALRNPLDKKTDATPGAEFAALFSNRGKSPAPATAPAKRTKPAAAKKTEVAPPIPAPTLEVVTGGKRQVYTF
ncbi:MAG: Flp pilus assembly protein CpaB [Acidobacteria bacterium]|nr:Flp pilus assembly protein CpaB [Acidobacteriota bacterium]MBI3657961.1 Flp pilus assembly protein CpaB [Acidobacteriota bacterium]